MPGTDRLPSYAELPLADGGGRSAWGLFGPDDNVGLVNLQTPERIAQAASEIRTGRVFPLGAAVDEFDPPLFGRMAPAHRLIEHGGSVGFDDELHFNAQGSSQWDSLAHVPARPDAFYNGVTAAQIRADRRNTVDHWARRGIAGRAVVLDLAGVASREDPGYSPGDPVGFTVADLEAARATAGVEYRAGDVLLVYTGFDEWYRSLGDAERARAADSRQLTAAGLDHSEEMAAYLWDSHVCAVASDCPAVEVWPPDPRPESAPFGFLHWTLIGRFGMALGELWWLADLVRDCRSDGRYTAWLTSAPLHVRGGIGSPANAIAVK